jgi:DNA-directed RNA polymerase subunit alpha
MDTAIKCVETKKQDDGSIFASFEVEPLERGFGITLGNTFRRICLSHLEGTAVITARIDGVTHEFSTIPGVAEDVVEIILNFKSLVFKTDLTEIFNVNLNFKGPGVVTGKDLTLPAGVELVNPDLHIATLTEDRPFSAELQAVKGRGYVLAEEQPSLGRAIDVIPMDSSFMPIKRFSYRVEQIRIGESSEPSTNKFERLVMDLVSNGSIEPEKAISQAAKLLVRKLNSFLGLAGEGVQALPVKEAEPEVVEDYSNVGIESLNLSVRAYNCLKRANKNTLQDLIEMATDELMSIKNFGKKSAEEVIQTLNDRGFFLTDDPRKATQGTPPASKVTASAGGPFNPPFGMMLR